MPGLIRADRNYKGASPSEEKDEEGREGEEKRGRETEREEREGKKRKSTGAGLEYGVVLIHACQCLLMRPNETATHQYSTSILKEGKKKRASK